MLAQRLIVVLLLFPIGITAIALGGWFFVALIVVVLGLAAWEYWKLFQHGGYHPSLFILIVGVVALCVTRHVFGFQGSGLILTVLVLLAMAMFVLQYEKGSSTAAVDFNITLGGILYLGWLGSYICSLRNLPDGLWWFLTAMPVMWVGDGMAYFVGSRIGRHKMTQKVSPNKSWEGYIGGIIGGALGAMLFASLWHLRAPDITWVKGMWLGLAIGTIAPLGDLGESMLKREFGVKDTSHILPGHGGIMDRIDSWLWAAPIGYYLIVLLWM